MNYGMLAQRLAQDTDGIVFDVHSLYAHLLQVAVRRGCHGRPYELALLWLAMIFAKMAGEDTPSGIAAWGRARKGMFIEAFALKRPAMPGHNSIAAWSWLSCCAVAKRTPPRSAATMPLTRMRPSNGFCWRSLKIEQP